MSKRIFPLLMAIVLVLSMHVAVFAHDVPDMTRTGSIAITMRHGRETIGGGTLTMYRVGEIFEDDGNYGFRPAGDFTDCGESFEDLYSPELAQNLTDFALSNQFSGQTKEIGQDGTVRFSDLELGLYLIVQEQAAEGFSESSPFLISVPKQEAGAYIYEVDASPKVELIPAPTVPPTEPPPKEPSLPQTGQLNWPIPVLAVTGSLLFIFGWALCFNRSKSRYEK